MPNLSINVGQQSLKERVLAAVLKDGTVEIRRIAPRVSSEEAAEICIVLVDLIARAAIAPPPDPEVFEPLTRR